MTTTNNEESTASRKRSVDEADTATGAAVAAAAAAETGDNADAQAFTTVTTTTTTTADAASTANKAAAGGGSPPTKKAALDPSSAAVAAAAAPVVSVPMKTNSAAAAASAARAVVAPAPPSAASRSTAASGGGGSGSGKAYKGLRHFSMMVCKKVEQKGTTSYNEVADELVRQVVEERRREDPSGRCDEKNIRRRVYDALNVLMAMDIITKDKKAISWKGLPTSAHQDLDMLGRERDFREREVHRKREALRELLVQQVCFRNLVQHNQRRETEQQQQRQQQQRQHHHPAEEEAENKIPLPFIVVNTNSSAVIQCNMSRDLTDVMFDFSQPFEINDDNTILKRLGMHHTSMAVLREMLPEDLLKYCQDHGLLDSVLEGAAAEAASDPAAAVAAAPPPQDPPAHLLAR